VWCSHNSQPESRPRRRRRPSGPRLAHKLKAWDGQVWGPTDAPGGKSLAAASALPSSQAQAASVLPSSRAQAASVLTSPSSSCFCSSFCCTKVNGARSTEVQGRRSPSRPRQTSSGKQSVHLKCNLYCTRYSWIINLDTKLHPSSRSNSWLFQPILDVVEAVCVPHLTPVYHTKNRGRRDAFPVSPQRNCDLFLAVSFDKLPNGT